MATKAQLEDALRDAMRAHDEVRKRALRMALSAVRMAEIDKGQEVDEPTVIAILQKEVKSHQETVDEAQRAGRTEMAASAQANIDVLEGFLPQPFSTGELEDLARQAVAEVGATSPREMGQVMKVLLPRLQGRATGEQASQAVRKFLAPAS